MNVWEKQDDGSMKIKADIWNTDMNPWEMMQEGEHKMDNDKDQHKY